MSADIVSFDVFDTLLTRAVGAPSSLFLLLGRLPEVTRMTNWTPEEFARLRIEAERRARSGRREITLHDIYSELGAGLGLPAAQRQQLADCELALERRLSRALPKATSLLKAHEADRRVALSDMYLPAHFVTELLERQGFAELLDRVIVSSEHGVTKSDGGLFGVLIELEQTTARRCRHVGDNPLSDVRVPRLLGLQAEHVPDAALNRYERIWEQHRWSSGGLSSLFAGASRLARLEADASAELAPIVDVAAGVAAPLLSAYVLWVLASAQREGLKRLYFLARDGEILYLLAQRFAAKLELDIELRYLYGSRSVYHRAGLATKPLAQAAWAWKAMYRLTPLDVLKRLGLPPERAEAALARLGLGNHQGELGDAAIKRLIADDQLQDEVRGFASQLLARVQGYLTQEGLFDGTPAAVVDTGWAGRVVASMSSSFPAGVAPLKRAYLFGYLKREDGYDRPDVLRGYLFDEYAKTGFRDGFDQAYGPLETFAVANHGMTVDFAERDGRYEPVLASVTNPVLDDWPWDTFRSTVMRFADELVLDPDIAAAGADLRGAVAEVLDAFWSHPTPEEARVWGAYVYEDDILAASRNPLAKPISAADFLGKASPRYEGKRLWLAASVQLSSPLVRPLARAGLRLNERRHGGGGVRAVLPARWRRRAGLLTIAAKTRRAAR
jgi:FMN phosphatase YigB (HAD superfamily)